MTSLDVLFTCIGLITAASAVLAVTTPQVVHAALWLVVSLGSLAGCYLVLGAELVALVQLLIYVGAVVVLVLFALMLTRAPIGASTELDTSRAQRAAAALVGGGTAGLLGGTLVAGLGGGQVQVLDTATPDVAAQIFGTWVWPFELLSLLLLIALVAALAVSRIGTGDANAPDVHTDAETGAGPATASGTGTDPGTDQGVGADPGAGERTDGATP